MIDDFRPQGSVKPAPKLKPISTPTKLPELTETPFQTPEQIAGEQSSEPVVGHGHADTTKVTPSRLRTLFSKFSWPPNRQEIASVVVVLLLASVGGWGYLALHKTTSAAVKPTLSVKIAKKVIPAPTTVASALSGLPVAPSVNQQPVTGVMIENTPDARPQAGLSQAGVVFEAVAEAGITRFLALFQDQQPANVGPIRSARPYYVQWDLGFDAPYAHVGGSPDALADITSWNVKDLNQFYNGSYYHRITTREAPHNVYTGIPTLSQLEQKKGYTSSSFTSFPRKAAAPSKLAPTSSIDLTLSSADYNVHYDYVAASDSYNRSEGGTPQVDSNTNQQLSPKVVIAIVVPETQGALDSSGAYYSDYNPLGSGVAYVFQDGTTTVGTWAKPNATSQISFSDATDKTIQLNAGQTWITAITGTSKISYK